MVDKLNYSMVDNLSCYKVNNLNYSKMDILNCFEVDNPNYSEVDILNYSEADNLNYSEVGNLNYFKVDSLDFVYFGNLFDRVHSSILDFIEKDILSHNFNQTNCPIIEGKDFNHIDYLVVEDYCQFRMCMSYLFRKVILGY